MRREHSSIKSEKIIIEITDYILSDSLFSQDAFNTAHYCLLDSMACALQALQFPACTKLLGPIVEGAEMKNGCPVPGTRFQLDPVQASFNIGSMIRWLDYNDTWLAAEWGHPSDNIAGILAISDYLSRLAKKNHTQPLLMQDVLRAMIKAYEVQGILALDNSFNDVGLDHVILVRIATTATVAGLLGATAEQLVNALSNAWLDGGALRTYRHAPNTGSRKSWAAGDATSRGVWHALNALKGEMGYATALSAKPWGFYEVLFAGNEFSLAQALDSYVVENILFKVSFPAEFHAQTAVEAAIELHPLVKSRTGDIEKIVIETQQAGCRIIDKSGPLNNPADRDHCLQYMVAIALLYGNLKASDYENERASDPEIDLLRRKMHVQERAQYTIDYLDPEKRSIANSVQVFFTDKSCTDRVEVEFPIGHRRRRKDAIPLLQKKYIASIDMSYADNRHAELRQAHLKLFADPKLLSEMSVLEFMACYPTIHS